MVIFWFFRFFDCNDNDETFVGTAGDGGWGDDDDDLSDDDDDDDDEKFRPLVLR
jgi:hypothetical protein